MKKVVPAALVAALLLAPVTPARAAVNVERRGDENPMVEIARSTMYGAIAGTLVGSALALASDAKDGTAIKWGFVVGTFVGAGYGFYTATTRPAATGLLEWRDGHAGSGGLAAVQAAPGAARVTAVAIRF